MMYGHEKSDPAIVAVKPANKAERSAAELVEQRAGTKGNADQQSTRRAQERASVSQALGRIRQAAKQRKKEKFTTLFHHISVGLLRLAFFEIKKDAAPGVDSQTWQDYEADLDRNIEDLHDRVHKGAYRAQPSRRLYIPKPDGRQRPIAIAALEDKIVQRATAAVLNTIYEEDFLGFSYGFRPKRSQHDALDALVVGITSTKEIRRAPDRRPAHPPLDPEMAQGGHSRRWSRDGQGKGHRTGVGNIAAPGQRLPALQFRSLGGTLATARGHGRHDHRAVCGRYRGRF